MSQGRISTCHDSHGIALCYELYHRGYNIMDGLRLKDPKHDQFVELDIHLRFHRAWPVIVLTIVGLLGNCHWFGGSARLAAQAALFDGSLSDL